MKFNHRWLVPLLALGLLAAFLYGDLPFFKLTIVGHTPLSYNFSDGFQGWQPTSNHIRVQEGSVVGHPESGGTAVYEYPLTENLDGWTATGSKGSGNRDTEGAYSITVSEASGYVELYAMAKSIAWAQSRSGVYAEIYRAFDFRDASSATLEFRHLRDAVTIIVKDMHTGDALGSYSIPAAGDPGYGIFVLRTQNLDCAVGHEVVLSLRGPELSTTNRRTRQSWVYLKEVKITVEQPPVVATGYIERAFDFSSAGVGGTLEGIHLTVDYGSTGGLPTFFGVEIHVAGGTVLADEFTVGGEHTYSREVIGFVEGSEARIRIGGSLHSEAPWWIESVEIEPMVTIDLITPILDDGGYPSLTRVSIPVKCREERSGLVVGALIDGLSFEAVTDQSGLAEIDVDTPRAGDYPMEFYAMDPGSGEVFRVTETVTVVPSMKTELSYEPNQYTHMPASFEVRTVDAEMNLPADVAVLRVQVWQGGGELPFSISKLGTGEYRVEFTASVGEVSFDVTPEAPSRYLAVGDSGSISMLAPTLILTPNQPVEARRGEAHSIFVKVTDVDNQPAEATVTATVKTPAGMTESFTTTRVSLGTYMFDYTFQDEGAYQFTLIAASPEAGRVDATGVTYVGGIPDAPNPDKDGPAGGDLLFVIGAAVLVGGIAVALLVRRRR